MLHFPELHHFPFSPGKGQSPLPGTLGELLNRPPRPEGRRGYGAQIFDFSAPSRAKALPHYSPSLVGLTPSLLLSPSVTAGRRPRLRGWRPEDSALALRRAGTPGK